MTDFDVIVVGAGPAGVSAALEAARGGLRVALLERGAYPGAKNLMGGVLYTHVLAELIPDFRDRGAPLERHVVRRGMSLLSAEAEMSLGFRNHRWDRPPHNHSYTVLRARFDRWFAGVAEAEGVELLAGVVVDRVLKDGEGRAQGVAVRMPEGEDPSGGELRAPLVILAEGANGMLAEAEGLRPRPSPRHMALGVKETLALPRETIEERFGLEGEQGVAWEYVGEATAGLRGAGFVYTNRDTLSVGVVVYASDLAASGLMPLDLLDRFKAHPAVAPLLKGGEVLEYGAHLIPETGYDRLPLLFRDGVLLAGDAAGLVSTGPSHEGANYAMASGRMAGQTAVAAHRAGDFSSALLAQYRRRLEDSFVLKDMVHHRAWPGFLEQNPHVLSRWPAAAAEMAEAWFRVGGTPRSERGAEVWDLFQRRVGIWPFAATAFQMRNALRILGYGKTDKLLEYLARNW
ncbi:FAD-dependent oxidoreductase [Deferrisoma camini]|uniref:FAD-dependent oxidoreductase n=1 Tax=Deferrisoma camini TaxID=1035120 RepID=UPI00046D303D|nr:FAD-dependent oxidoreductase [Deferrisoma camini]